MKQAQARLWGAWALALAVGVLGAAGARAQSAADVTAARDLFIEGSRLAEKGKWTEARDRYERSLALKRAAVTLYSLGVAQRNTGKLVEALESFRAFLAEPSAAATRPYEGPARGAATELEKRIARIDVVLEPAAVKSAVVRVDGVTVPAAAVGQPRAVNPGAHVVIATAVGWRAARTEVTLAEGQRATVKLVLERAAEVDVTTARAAASPRGTARPGGAPTAKAAAPQRVLPFALMGTGAAVVGAGVALGLFGVSSASQAPWRDGPAAADARTIALVGDVLVGVGLGAAAAGGIVLWVRPARGASPATAVSPWIHPGGIGVQGRF